jgi:hypothetical protein
MARRVGQIVRRGPRTWLVRVYNGRNCETKKRRYLNQTIHGGLRAAQAHLIKMLNERARGRNLDSSKQTLNHYVDSWLKLCATPRLRAKSLKDYEGLLRRHVRPQLGSKALTAISALDIQMLYQDMLTRGLSFDPLHPCSLALGPEASDSLEPNSGESRRFSGSTQTRSHTDQTLDRRTGANICQSDQWPSL